MDYDVIIVGGGPAGLFSAFHLVENSDLRVLMVEKGRKPLARICPNHNLQKCAGLRSVQYHGRDRRCRSVFRWKA